MQEACKEAYTHENITSAFECTEIVPFNPRRILGKYSRTSAPDPKTPSGTKTAIPAIPANNRGVRHLCHEVQHQLQAVDDPILQTLVNKLANAVIGGLTTVYLQEDRAVQLEAALAIKTEEMQQTRKHTRLTNAKVITGGALLKLRLQQQAGQSTPKTKQIRKGLHKHVSFNRPPQSCPSTGSTPRSNIISSSSSSSYVSCSGSDTELDRIDSASESITIYVRTPGDIPGPSTTRALPTTPTPAPRLLKVSLKPLLELRILRLRWG